MKRRQGARRRDRASGQSPYAKHAKREYAYSPTYRAWFTSHHVGSKGNSIAERAGAQHGN